MQYQLKQGIDRDEMRAERIGPIYNLDKARERIYDLQKMGQNIDETPDYLMEDNLSPFVLADITSYWSIWSVQSTGTFAPTISFDSFIDKYFEPCNTN